MKGARGNSHRTWEYPIAPYEEDIIYSFMTSLGIGHGRHRGYAPRRPVDRTGWRITSASVCRSIIGSPSRALAIAGPAGSSGTPRGGRKRYRLGFRINISGGGYSIHYSIHRASLPHHFLRVCAESTWARRGAARRATSSCCCSATARWAWWSARAQTAPSASLWSCPPYI